MPFANKEFKSIRIVNTNKIWQDNESGWCEIAVYDAENGELIGQGWDMVTFSGKGFSIEAKKDIDGLIYYGATFKFPKEEYHNNLEITVI
jgi:hypothetical protein